MRIFWVMSLATDEYPLGCAFVEADSLLEAIGKLGGMGIVPDGTEIIGHPFLLEQMHPGFNPDTDCNRLWTLPQMQEAGMDPVKADTGKPWRPN